MTRFISLRTSPKNSPARATSLAALSRGPFARLFDRFGAHVRQRRCRVSLYRHSELAGQEGIEPPTPGFGDRCSAN